MKKENYGIPAMLLCVGLYLLGLYSAVGTFWPIIAATVVVFALQFDSKVKKTAVQSLALALIVSAVYVVFNVIDVFTNMIDTYATLRSDNGFIKFMETLEGLVKLATYVIYGILIICAAIKNDIFVGKTHLIVDGFVPAKPMPQQMYNGPQQPFNGGQPMNGGQPINGPQPMNSVHPMNGGQPMTGAHPTKGGQPMNGAHPRNGARPMNSVQPMNGAHPMNGPQQMPGGRPMNDPQQMHNVNPMKDGQIYNGQPSQFNGAPQSMRGQEFKPSNGQNNSQNNNENFKKPNDQR
ncbi:MAG: hypothetical protein Q4G58_17510 [bacterium]|nr:hypothetical protein [bacterium]